MSCVNKNYCYGNISFEEEEKKENVYSTENDNASCESCMCTNKIKFNEKYKEKLDQQYKYMNGI